MLRRHDLGKKTLEEKKSHIEAPWGGVLAAECVDYFDYVFLIYK